MKKMLHPTLSEALDKYSYPEVKAVFNKKMLLLVMNGLDFDIHDIDYRDGQELVCKKGQDGSTAWWEIEREGSGFTSLFKGAIKRVCMFEEETSHEFTVPKT